MLITVTIPDAIAGQITAEAQANGMDLNHYIEKIVEGRPAAQRFAAIDRRAAVEPCWFSRKKINYARRVRSEKLIHEGHHH